MAFIRLRRLRSTAPRRDLFAQSQISPTHLIMPYFLLAGKNKREPIQSMPGINRLSLDNLIKDVKEARRQGIKAVLLFGICRNKDTRASQAYSPRGIVQQAIRAIKKDIQDIIVITDVCLCGYITHGHCGIIRAKGKEQRAKSKRHNSMLYALSSMLVDNDATLKVLSKIALSHAASGADFVAPSAMMDGQVGVIRQALDKNGFLDTGILAYSVKYASNFYAPFRQALGSQPQFGDRKTYQMDYRNSDEALREIKQDIDEGADIIMVKPALAYLDIIHRVKEKFNIPIAAYNVSGEYAMLKQYCQKTKIEKDLILEILTSIKRAGADLIITYHAQEVARWLRE